MSPRQRAMMPSRSSSAWRSTGSRLKYCARAFTRSSSAMAGGNFGSDPGALDSGDEQRFEPLPLLAQHGLVGFRGGFREGVDRRDAVVLRAVFADDPELLQAAQHDVRPAVRQPLGVGDDPGAAHRIHRRCALVVRFEARLQQRHADDPVTRQRIGQHRAVAWLEDVERQEDVGEQHHVRQREERNRSVGSIGMARDPASGWSSSCGSCNRGARTGPAWPAS